MSATYEIHLHNNIGQRLAILPAWLEFNTVRSVNAIGTLDLKLPLNVLPPEYFQKDYILILWRALNNGTRTIHNETLYYMRRIRHSDTAQGRFTWLNCVDANERLRRRIIAYYAGSSEAAKSGAADDIMKALVRENLASTASDYAGATDRGLSASGFTVQADHSLAATTSKGVAWRNLYDVLRELADDSRSQGIWLAFDMALRPGYGQEFRTYPGQRGIDRRAGANALLLSEAAGSLIDVDVELDYTEEVTTVYAGGRGEQDDRIIQAASSADRLRTQAGRIERFTTAYQGETAAYVLSEAEADLAGRRPRFRLSGQVQESHYVQYGRNLSFGDYVRAEARGYTIDARLDTVVTQVDESGEKIVVDLKAEALL